jgi:hypothetical protein
MNQTEPKNVPPTDDPKWVRMPTAGEKLEGLSRHSLYRAIQAGRIRFRSVKLRPDAKRGIPYVAHSDILRLIDGSAEAAV